jgi:uncharacterized protein (DUF427 family)
VRALYVWEWPHYPQYYVPLEDVNPAALSELEHRVQEDGPAAGTVWSPCAALDAWFEEDEEVFVHPRNRTRGSTRCYLDRTTVNFQHLIASDTQTACPYKGRTSTYWSVRTNGEVHADLAWSYDFPVQALTPFS